MEKNILKESDFESRRILLYINPNFEESIEDCKK